MRLEGGVCTAGGVGSGLAGFRSLGRREGVRTGVRTGVRVGLEGPAKDVSLEPGCDTQSSERESSQAGAMVNKNELKN